MMTNAELAGVSAALRVGAMMDKEEKKLEAIRDE